MHGARFEAQLRGPEGPTGKGEIMECRNVIVGKHPRDGWLTVDIALEPSEGRTVTLTDHSAANDVERFAASGAFWYRKDSPDCHTSGQMLDVLASTEVRPVAPWTSADLGSLLRLWKVWHLNDMQAGCEHMDLPADPSYDVRRGITCDVTGYVYGHSWLARRIDASDRDEIVRLLALAERSERFK